MFNILAPNNTYTALQGGGLNFQTILRIFQPILATPVWP